MILIFLFVFLNKKSVFFSSVSLSNKCFSPSEIQSGLIGVGLINVEDRSGTLSLDKGEFLNDNMR